MFSIVFKPGLFATFFINFVTNITIYILYVDRTYLAELQSDLLNFNMKENVTFSFP